LTVGARTALAAGVLLALAAALVFAWTRDGGPAADAGVPELRAQLAEERRAREALEARLADVESALAALRADPGAGPAIDEADAAASVGAGTPADASDAAEAARLADEADPAGGHAWFDERRFGASGIAERDVADLKRVFDEVELERLYLQNQATREGWPDERLNAELTALGDRMTQVRSTYGDEVYDWFLYATNRPNRVLVEGVLGGSAAEEAGIRKGDVILSYDRERMFRPGPLVQGTLQGDLDDRVDVEIWRQGERIRVTLPRGPLGVRLGRKTAPPDSLDGDGVN
jgi:hypothetical protein